MLALYSDDKCACRGRVLALARRGLFLLLVVTLGLLLGCGRFGSKQFFGLNQSVSPFYIVLSEASQMPECVTIDEGGILHIRSGECGDGVIEYDITQQLINSSAQSLWVQATVVSRRVRTGVHVHNGITQSYSYHSGDGREQILLSEIAIPSTGFNPRVRIYISETGDTVGDVSIKSIAVSPRVEGAPTPRGMPEYSRWNRTNNPNSATWVDRWASPLRNYSVHVPNQANPIWERYFAIGIDDRFSRGDYFCFPDDFVVIASDESGDDAYPIFLGSLPWTRVVEEDRDTLRIKFVYDGPIRMHERAHLIHELTRGQSAQTPLFRDKVTLHLEKTYIFKVSEASGTVAIQGRISGLKDPLATWVLLDSAFLDFSIGSSQGVSIYNGRDVNQEAFVSTKRQKSPLANMLFRFGEGIPLAAAYSLGNSDFAFGLRRMPIVEGYKSFLRSFEGRRNRILESPLDPRSPWNHGIAFYFVNGRVDGSFRRLLASNYSSIDDAWNQLVAEGRKPPLLE